ncbi:transcriptional regulator, AraC family (plasmid) [Rhizobium leguminosarum bv. trifolii WSM2304]|uniref:Transcriptional regulator, AraC family n=1 Tax=Rhizobium leguminosarum bv. trifolii (strain WSM2304) TaxID=395492 RepID=A0ABF7QZ91_RHILW|nr:helix-turn-helix transcriptional regulator [Rhizobium leguminosarum]ACI59509.1 transcriptional regulator, AraC family [Rhizobium leguminosarum bv. trifolii WSM2304]
MPQKTATEFVPRFQGSTFEGLVETFTGHFGPFDASPIGSTASFQWSTDFWTNGTLSLITSEFHNEWRVKAVPETAEWLSILLPRSGAINVSLGKHMVESRPGTLALIHNHEADFFLTKGLPHIADVLRLDWSVLLQTAAAIFEKPVNGSLGLSPMVDLTVPAGQLIGNMCRTIIGGIRNHGPLLQSPVAMANLTQALADLLIRTIPNRYSRHLEKQTSLIAPWHVRDAIDFMQANVSKPITMAVIAEAVGVSVRALEMGFRSFRETTPAAYLRTLRLRAVRNDLLEPSNRESVRAVCLKWGFFHFGRFSAVYRSVYGESPSETRKRRARVPHGSVAGR